MFGPHFYIDTFQDLKKTLTNQVIKDPTLNKAANDYIVAQTAFAKMLANNAVEISKHSVDAVAKVLFPQKEQASPAPYKVDKEAK